MNDIEDFENQDIVKDFLEHLDAACEEIERSKVCCKDLKNKVDDLQNQKEFLTKYLGRC